MHEAKRRRKISKHHFSKNTSTFVLECFCFRLRPKTCFLIQTTFLFWWIVCNFTINHLLFYLEGKGHSIRFAQAITINFVHIFVSHKRSFSAFFSAFLVVFRKHLSSYFYRWKKKWISVLHDATNKQAANKVVKAIFFVAYHCTFSLIAKLRLLVCAPKVVFVMT